MRLVLHLAFFPLFRSDEPKKVQDNLFDCSGSNYAQFEVVFRCNFVKECAGGEDEMGCPYTTPHCEHGAFDLSNNSDKLLTISIEKSMARS